MKAIKPKAEVFLQSPKKQQVTLNRIGTGQIEYPKEGGILYYNAGYKYPEKYFPFSEAFLRNDIIKRVLRMTLMFITSKPIIYFMPLALLLPYKKHIFWEAVKAFTNLSDRFYRDIYLKPRYFCKSGREIYRVGEEYVKTFNKEKRETLWRFVMAICTMWEFDDKYRYTGQDFFGEVNKEQLLKNPSKEFKRVFKIVLKRQPSGGINNRMKWVGAIITWSLKWRWFKRTLIEVAKRIDFKKLALDKEDFYYCLRRDDYNHKGLSYEDKQIIRKKIWDIGKKPMKQ